MTRLVALMLVARSAAAFAQPTMPPPDAATASEDTTTDTIRKLEQQNAVLDEHAKVLDEQLQVLRAQMEVIRSDLEHARQAPEAKPSQFSMPDWVTRIDDRSDIRLRFDEAKAPTSAYVTRKRYRPRLRVGGVVTLQHGWEIGFRLASAPTVARDTGGDPLSTNQTFEDNASRKPVGVDWAFARWTPLRAHGVTASIAVGKLENPPNFTEDVFDVDYTPEGAAEVVTWKGADHLVSLYLGQFELDEIQFGTRDPFLLLEQIHEESSWGNHLATTANVAALTIGHASQLTTATVPDSNHGNTRDSDGALSNKYQLVIVDARATVKLDRAPGYRGSFPISLYGEYIHNFGADADNTGYSFGPTVGDVSQRGSKIGREQRGHWEVSYRYQHLESDYNYEELTASDNGAFYESSPPSEPAPMSFKPVFLNGTNLRGHAYRAAYAPLDFLVVDLRIWRNEAIHVTSAVERVKGTRLLFDVVLRF